LRRHIPQFTITQQEIGREELAFSWLEGGLAAGAIAPFYKDEPVWDSIRSNPRFADLLRRMGVSQ